MLGADKTGGVVVVAVVVVVVVVLSEGPLLKVPY